MARPNSESDVKHVSGTRTEVAGSVSAFCSAILRRRAGRIVSPLLLLIWKSTHGLPSAAHDGGPRRRTAFAEWRAQPPPRPEAYVGMETKATTTLRVHLLPPLSHTSDTTLPASRKDSSWKLANATIAPTIRRIVLQESTYSVINGTNAA